MQSPFGIRAVPRTMFAVVDTRRGALRRVPCPRSRGHAWRTFALLLCATAAACLAQSAPAQDSQPSSAEQHLLDKANEIHQMVITLDTHVDIAGPEYATEQLDPGIDNPRLQCDLVKMVRGGVDGVFLAVFVGQGRCDAGGFARAHHTALAKFEAIHRLTETMYPQRCELATSPDDVLRIAKTGKRAVMIGIENGYPIGMDLANVERFYRLGTRYITLSHNGHNQICDSCNPRPSLGDQQARHDGLSPLGKQIVAEMNRLGMMIDVSHVAESTFWDLMEVSTAPVIASHSGCRALCDHPRNLGDRQLRALARRGGVIQIVPCDHFLKRPSTGRRQAIEKLARQLGISMGPWGPTLSEATRSQWQRFQKGVEEVDREHAPATLEDFVDHIDHAAKVAGINHVGIGSDFDGGAGIPGFQNHAEALNLTFELLRRGYEEHEIRKIWGGNLLRVWRAQTAAPSHGRPRNRL